MVYKTVKVKKYSDVIEEFVAAGAITPGMLLELDSNGEVAPHSEAGGSAYPLFALEDELQGKGIDDNYAADDQVQVWLPGRGDIVNALVSGADVAIGDFLMSAGDGSLEKFSKQLTIASLVYTPDDTNGLQLTARMPGVAGNNIALALTGSAAVTAGSETVTVTGTAPYLITVTYANTSGSESNFAQVVNAINADTDAKALVFAEVVGTGTTKVTDDLLATPLTGGEDVNPGMVVAQAAEAVSPDGAVVRGLVRII